MPPVGQKRKCGSGPAIDFSQSTPPDASAGKNLRSLKPRAASATAWYLFASPDQIDTVEYAYLEGQDGVYIETRQGFDVDGVEIKARLDFGAKAIDWRGMQKNVGS